jgi:hypothetical protein
MHLESKLYELCPVLMVAFCKKKYGRQPTLPRDRNVLRVTTYQTKYRRQKQSEDSYLLGCDAASVLEIYRPFGRRC